MLSIAEAKAQLAQALNENKSDFIERIKEVRSVLEELAGYTSVPDLIPEAKSDIEKINQIFGFKRVSKTPVKKTKASLEERKNFVIEQLSNGDMYQQDLMKLAQKKFNFKNDPMYFSEVLKDSRFAVTKDGYRKKIALVNS